jgi:hypothetical protein
LFSAPISVEAKAAITAFAILARGLLILEDLAGVPQIVKSTSILFLSPKKQKQTKVK